MATSHDARWWRNVAGARNMLRLVRLARLGQVAVVGQQANPGRAVRDGREAPARRHAGSPGRGAAARPGERGHAASRTRDVPLAKRAMAIKARIHEVLAQTGFNVSEPARRLGMYRRILVRKPETRQVNRCGGLS